MSRQVFAVKLRSFVTKVKNFLQVYTIATLIRILRQDDLQTLSEGPVESIIIFSNVSSIFQTLTKL